MKKIIIILVVVLVGYSIFYWFVLSDKVVTPEIIPEVVVEETIEEPLETPEEVVENKMCFARDQKATEDAPYEVSENIEIIVNGKNVSGTKKGTQNGPDMTNGYEGTLSGEILDGVYLLTFDYTIEGSDQKEKEEYLLKGDSFVKQRYPLKEESGFLVPDKTKEMSEVSYLKEICK